MVLNIRHSSFPQLSKTDQSQKKKLPTCFFGNLTIAKVQTKPTKASCFSIPYSYFLNFDFLRMFHHFRKILAFTDRVLYSNWHLHCRIIFEHLANPAKFSQQLYFILILVELAFRRAIKIKHCENETFYEVLK